VSEGPTPRRILAIADSDSYVKWGAALVDAMPGDWQRDLVVLDTLWRPSADQLTTAVAGTRWRGAPPPVVSLEELGARVAAEAPDAVLFAMRGPAVKVALRQVLASAPGPRPILLSGMPGISIPATRRAIAYRAQVDVMVVHSRRELLEFGLLAQKMGMPQRFALAGLPFVRELGAPAVVDPSGPMIFATQAKVPVVRSERLHLLERLAETARQHPHQKVVIKVRAVAGETQTHLERHEYADLLSELDPPAPDNLVVLGGPMAEHLDGAAGLVTVSSTAALEAMGLGVPVLCIDDFGVRDGLINTVFEGSGVLAPSEELVAGRFRHPEPGWLDDNYFHPRSDDDWAATVEELIAVRDSAGLHLRRQSGGTAGGALRVAWDRKKALGDRDTSLAGRIAVLVGTPAAALLRLARKVRRVLRRRGLAVGVDAVEDADGDEQARDRTPLPSL
jgi:hypothetical protein